MFKLNSFTKKAVLGLSALSLLATTQPARADLTRPRDVAVALVSFVTAGFCVAELIRIRKQPRNIKQCLLEMTTGGLLMLALVAVRGGK